MAKDNPTDEGNPKRFIWVKHSCGQAWRVSRNALDDGFLYCPDCLDRNGFKEVLVHMKQDNRRDDSYIVIPAAIVISFFIALAGYFLGVIK